MVNNITQKMGTFISANPPKLVPINKKLNKYPDMSFLAINPPQLVPIQNKPFIRNDLISKIQDMSPNIVSVNASKNNELKSFSIELDINITSCHIHCITCKRMFKFATYFTKHFFTCYRRIDFQCIFCGKHKFEIEDNFVGHLQSHFKEEHEVLYCYKCNMEFYGAYNVKEHEKMCPIKPPMYYTK
jgi:hypothetical protein